LQPHLVVGDLPVLQVAAHLGDLEPVQSAQRLACPGDAVADRRVHALRRRAHDLGDAVGVVGHAASSVVPFSPRTGRGMCCTPHSLSVSASFPLRKSGNPPTTTAFPPLSRPLCSAIGPLPDNSPFIDKTALRWTVPRSRRNRLLTYRRGVRCTLGSSASVPRRSAWPVFRAPVGTLRATSGGLPPSPPGVAFSSRSRPRRTGAPAAPPRRGPPEPPRKAPS